MSIKAIDYVWDYSPQFGSHLLALLAIADSCDNDDFTCWLGIKGIARKCRMTETNARKIVHDLAENHEIIIIEKAGKETAYGWTNRYYAVLPGINCEDYQDLCKKLNVEPTPYIAPRSKTQGKNNNPKGKNRPVTGDTPITGDRSGVSRVTGNPSFDPSLDGISKDIPISANANRVADNVIIALQSLTANQLHLLETLVDETYSLDELLSSFSDSDIETVEDLDLIEKDITPYWNHCRYHITEKGKQVLEAKNAVLVIEPISPKHVKGTWVQGDTDKPKAKKGRKPAYVLTDSDKEILQFVDATGEDMAKTIEQGISQIKLGQLSTLVDNGYLDMRGVPADAHFILTDKGRKAIAIKPTKPVKEPSDKQLENNRKADIAIAYGEWIGSNKDVGALRKMTQSLAETLPDLTGQELKDFFSVQTGLNKNLKRMDSIMRELVIWRAGKAPDTTKNTSQDMLPVEQDWYRE